LKGKQITEAKKKFKAMIVLQTPHHSKGKVSMKLPVLELFKSFLSFV
jgi:hypothetical protein